MNAHLQEPWEFFFLKKTTKKSIFIINKIKQLKIIRHSWTNLHKTIPFPVLLSPQNVTRESYSNKEWQKEEPTAAGYSNSQWFEGVNFFIFFFPLQSTWIPRISQVKHSARTTQVSALWGKRFSETSKELSLNPRKPLCSNSLVCAPSNVDAARPEPRREGVQSSRTRAGVTNQKELSQVE